MPFWIIISLDSKDMARKFEEEKKNFLEMLKRRKDVQRKREAGEKKQVGKM